MDGLFGKFSNLIGQGPKTESRGVYIWGGVGRGKSMLMDLFFETINFKSKKRTHFHNFMAETHDLIHKLRKDESIKNNGDLIIPEGTTVRWNASVQNTKNVTLVFSESKHSQITDKTFSYNFPQIRNFLLEN